MKNETLTLERSKSAMISGVLIAPFLTALVVTISARPHNLAQLMFVVFIIFGAATLVSTFIIRALLSHGFKRITIDQHGMAKTGYDDITTTLLWRDVRTASYRSKFYLQWIIKDVNDQQLTLWSFEFKSAVATELEDEIKKQLKLYCIKY